MSFDRDLRAKEKAKYDDRFEDMQREAQSWIEDLIKRPILSPSSSSSSSNPASSSSISSSNGTTDLCDALKDGTILCEVVNAISPNAVRFKHSKMPFIQMENIASFLRFSRETLGVPAHDLFQTVDLYERKNVFQVVQSIHTFSRYASTYIKTHGGGSSAGAGATRESSGARTSTTLGPGNGASQDTPGTRPGASTSTSTSTPSELRFLGPKMSTSVSREFSVEQLNEAKNSVNTYQYGRVNGSTNVLRGSRRDPAGNIH